MRRVLIFAIVAPALLMMSVDVTIVATALHALQQGMDTSINWAGWTISAYACGFVLMLPISGKLCERYGRRRVFLASVAVFTLASLLCGLADSIQALIALRLLQAVGGAGFTPSVTGIIVDHFGPARDRAVSLFGSIFPIGAMIGPIFGGLFVTYWSWRGVFFVNVPIGLLILALALRYIPPDPERKPRRRTAMDARGTVLLGIGLFAAMLAASVLGEPGAELRSPSVWLPLALGVGMLWLFYRHIGRTPQPLIARSMISGPGFWAINLMNLVYGGLTDGAVALIPLYAISHYGMDALDSGTLLIAQGLAAASLSILATFALRRTGYRLPLYVGTALMALGMGLLAVEPPWGMPAYAWLALAAFLVGVGAGGSNPASRNAGLQLAPDQSAMIAALRTLFRQMGAIAMVAIATAILARATDPGSAQAGVYAAVAVLMLLSMPVIHRIPEHHGRW